MQRLHDMGLQLQQSVDGSVLLLLLVTVFVVLTSRQAELYHFIVYLWKSVFAQTACL
jgi:hypothetical protein